VNPPSRIVSPAASYYSAGAIAGRFARAIGHRNCAKQHAVGSDEHQRFPFDIENPSERALPLAIWVRIVDVHYVQVPGSHQIAHFRLGGFQV